MKSNKIISLLNIIEQFKNDEILDPDFQRGAVWNAKSYCELYNSILDGEDIGQITLWESKEYIKVVRTTLDGKEALMTDEDEVKLLILDGKQRLIGFLALLLKKDIGKTTSVYFNLDTGRFTTEKHSRNIRVQMIFSTELKLIGKDITMIDQVRNVFEKFEISIVIYKDITVDRAINIFNKINTSGVKLSKVNVFAARTRSENFNFYKRVEALRKRIGVAGYGNLKEKTIIQMLSVISYGSIKVNKTEKFIRDNDELINAFTVLEESIDRSIRFLDKIMRIESYEEVHYEFHLIALVYFFSKAKRSSLEQNKILRAWIFKSSFSNRFKGANYDLMDEELVLIDMVRDSNSKDIIDYDWRPNEKELIMTTYQKSSAKTKAMISLLKSLEPKSVTEAINICESDNKRIGDKIEHHHVFAKDYLKRRKMTSKMNSLMNIALLTKSDNLLLSDTAPSNVVPLLHTNLKHDYQVVMESLALDIEERIFYDNDFSFFLEERAKRIVEHIVKVSSVE